MSQEHINKVPEALVQVQHLRDRFKFYHNGHGEVCPGALAVSPQDIQALVVLIDSAERLLEPSSAIIELREKVCITIYSDNTGERGLSVKSALFNALARLESAVKLSRDGGVH